MKTIGIDCRFAGTQTGLGRYARELVTHLLKRDDPLQYVLFVRDEEETWLKALPGTKNREAARGHAAYTGQTLKTSNYAHYSLSEQRGFPKDIAQANIDLFFVLHFNVPLKCPVPFVVTIHDLILHHYPNQASMIKRFAYNYLMSHAVSHSKGIIVVW